MTKKDVGASWVGKFLSPISSLILISMVVAIVVTGVSVGTFSKGSWSIIAVRSIAINMMGINAVTKSQQDNICHPGQMVIVLQKHRLKNGPANYMISEILYF